LYSFIIHEGHTTQSGHYYSYIKSYKDNKWYKYNDDNVKLVGDFEKIANRSNAYILFYQKQYVGGSNDEQPKNMYQQDDQEFKPSQDSNKNQCMHFDAK
jgi:ubiquitin carboxyl-terminal hydrolase 25